MIISDILFIIAIPVALWSVVSAIAIASSLSDRGVKINWFLIRLLIIKYIGQYYEITKKEEGKPGKWFYSYIISLNSALFFAVIGIILKRAFGL